MTDLDADSPLTLPGFFDALADGTLLAGVCTDCGQVLYPPRPACYACGSHGVEVEPQSKRGTVYSYTAVHAAPPALKDETPYTIAVVELEDGGRITGRLDAPYEAVDIDDPVRLRVREPTDAEQSLALSYEAEWPLHEFVLE